MKYAPWGLKDAMDFSRGIKSEGDTRLQAAEVDLDPATVKDVAG